jgi:hypothetical protein
MFSLATFFAFAILSYNTGYTQKYGAVSKIIKKFISHLTQAQHTSSAAATVQVSHALITILQYVHPGSHDTHPHENQITADMLHMVWDEFDYRVDVCRVTQGAHIEGL